MISPQKRSTELQGVLVLNSQAHKKLGAGRSAETPLNVFARLQVSRDRRFRHADDDWLVISRFHKEALTSCRLVMKRGMVFLTFGLEAWRQECPVALAELLRPASMPGSVGLLPLSGRQLRLARLSVD